MSQERLERLRRAQAERDKKRLLRIPTRRAKRAGPEIIERHTDGLPVRELPPLTNPEEVPERIWR